MRDHRDYCLHVHDSVRILRDLKGSEMIPQEREFVEQVVAYSRTVIQDDESSILDTCVYLTVIADSGIQISIPKMSVPEATQMMQKLHCEFPEADLRVNTPNPLKFTVTF